MHTGPITVFQIQYAERFVKRPKKVLEADWVLFCRHVIGESQKELAIERHVTPPRLRQIFERIDRIVRYCEHMSRASLYEPESSIYLRPNSDLKRRLEQAKWTRKELNQT